MKTAISIPDELFEEAERLASEWQISRSQLYSRALQEFVARHAPDRLTEAMNRVSMTSGRRSTSLLSGLHDGSWNGSNGDGQGEV